MLETALEDIEENGMIPEEFENKKMPHFTLRLNAPHLLAATKPTITKTMTIIMNRG
jgi:hypothetical protein